MLNVKEIKKQFPILNREINGKPLSYLDNAATSQKPQKVIDSISDYYSRHNANVHRGIHTLSEEATDMYESARKQVASFIGANKTSEVIFTSGTTESVNLAAYGWGLRHVGEGDMVLVSGIEHHSNLIPWQQVCTAKNATLEIIPFDINGELLLDDIANLLDLYEDKIKVIVLTHASNVLASITPVKEIKKLIGDRPIKMAVDGAQAIPHIPVNMQSLGCDFYVFSGHKMLGPTGIGVLWAKQQILEEMNPVKFGGGMISEVKFDRSKWASPPEKFEGGTPNVAGAIGLGAAAEFLNEVGMEKIRAHELELNSYSIASLKKIEGLHVLGPPDPKNRGGLVSFYIDNIHAHDVASVLNSYGVAVRSGHHCTMPLHDKLQITASTRASYYLYNDKSNIDRLIEGIQEAKKILG